MGVALLCAIAPIAFGAIPDWVRNAIPAQLPETNGARAIVLLDDVALTVTNAGEITTRHRRVIKILTAAGRDDAYAAVWFDNDTKLRGLQGWSVDAAGREYALRERDAIEMTPPDYQLYTDARLKILRLPADIGSVVAYESERNERPYVLETSWRFQDDIPVLRARLQLALPQGWSHDAHWLHWTPVEPVAPATWELRSIPALADERRMPASSSIAGRLGIHLIEPAGRELGWSEVAQWFGKLAAPRNASTPELQTKVRELTSGASDPRRPLARYAQRDVRYVAVEIGIGGFQPHAASDVFAKKYGDCKDKATLLRTMLSAAGIESYYVLVHTTRGTTDAAFPAISAFNHVIAAIPVTNTDGLHAVITHPKLGKLLLFDPTSTLTPYGQLPPQLQASRGLLVTKDGGELIDLPSIASDANQLRRIAKLRLEDDGTLRGSVEEHRSGHVASSMRASLQPLNAAERVHYVESSIATHLPSTSVTEIAIEQLDDPESELVIRYKIAAKQYAKRVADMLLVRPRVLGQKAEDIVDTQTRTYDYVTDGPSVHVDEIDIAIPSSVKLDELPAKVEAKTPVVQYASASTFENGVLRYRRRFAMNAFVIERAALPELNRAWKQILGDERASAVFR